MHVGRVWQEPSDTTEDNLAAEAVDTGERVMTDIVERLRQGWRIELSDEELCEAADEIERLREALREYVATVVYEEGVTFIDRMPTAELRLLVESVSKEDK